MKLNEYDSARLLGDEAALRFRLRHDGFLFFRELLDADEIRAVRRLALGRLEAVGWLRPGTDPDQAIPGPRTHHDRGVMNGAPVVDPEWPRGYRAVQSIEDLHRIAHHPRLLAVLSALFGSPVVVHPRKIVRISYPGLDFPTPPHQDALFNQVPADVLTAWIPLGDCPIELGGLRVQRGSAARGLLPVRSDDGLGGESVDVPVDAPDWVDGDYRAGDVMLFHSRTVHMTWPNRSQTLRLSTDCRFQSVHDPIKLAALLPHGFSSGQLPNWTELTAGWRTTRWVEIEDSVRVKAVYRGQSGVSRLVPELAEVSA
jgi:hypothetical protein